MKEPFSMRECTGMLVAAAWGALLGVLPGAQFTVPLLGPPVAYLIMRRRRPLLSWQIPIIAASISFAMHERDPHGPYTEGPVLPVILLIWVVASLFSVPWPYIFQRRMQSDGDKPASFAKAAKTSFGAGFLVFLACGLILLGFAFCAMGVALPSSAQETIFDQSAAFLFATTGIALAVYVCLKADTIGLNKEIESLFGWILALAAATAIPMTFMDVYRGHFHCAQSSPNCLQLAPPLEVFLNCIASLEALAVVIWLLRRGRRAARLGKSIGVRTQT